MQNAARRGFLGRLTEEERGALTAALATRRFEDGAAIVLQGDRTTDVFFLLEGRAALTMYAADGRLVMLRELRPGDIFGEFAAIDGAQRTADVVAQRSVVVGRLSREAFFGVMETAPGVSRALMRHLVEIIRALGERIHEQTTLQVRERLLRELVRLGREAAGDQDRAVLAPPPTHAALAANIGTHREAVTKQLSSFARLGLVKKVDEGLRLPSLRALEREADRGAQAA